MGDVPPGVEHARVGPEGYVVRRIGSGTTHVVDWPLALVTATFITPYQGVPSPVVARCGAVLRDANGPLVAMQKGTPIRCRTCQRTAQSDDREAPDQGGSA